MLANPANNGHFYVENLQQLVNDYPHSGILRALLSHADNGQGINHAAAYLDPRALYTLMHSPDNLDIVSNDRIVQQLSNTAHYGTIIEDDPEQEPELNNTAEKEHFNTEPETVVIEPDYTSYHADAAEEQLPVEETEVDSHEHELVDEEPVNEEIAHTEQPIDTRDEAESLDGQQIDDPFYEEIVEIGPVAESIPEDERVTQAMPFEEEEHPVSEAVIESSVDDPVTIEASDEQEKKPETDNDNIREDELVTESPTFELAEPPRGIDDDVYDEIVGIENISFTPQPARHEIEMPQTEETSYIDEEELPVEATNEVTSENPVQKERELDMNDEAEKLIVGNIAATDYFAFDKAFSDRKQTEPAEVEPMAVVSPSENGSAHIESPAEEKKDVSKYNDDTLPYTFMWWLNKTRKEHAGIYQPFKLDTTQAIRQRGADELQQQYYENIFHISGFEELERSTPQQPVEFDLKTKEDRIIKKFIVEEPHITTPSSDKLDTENKAKKSSEDQNELVTETLARIYSDQMLYHKAISAYKKLMLKFPEKSRYFADQIEELERKSN